MAAFTEAECDRYHVEAGFLSMHFQCSHCLRYVTNDEGACDDVEMQFGATCDDCYVLLVPYVCPLPKEEPKP